MHAKYMRMSRMHRLPDGPYLPRENPEQHDEKEQERDQRYLYPPIKTSVRAFHEYQYTALVAGMRAAAAR